MGSDLCWLRRARALVLSLLLLLLLSLLSILLIIVILSFCCFCYCCCYLFVCLGVVRSGLGMMSALDTPPVYDVYESNVATRYIEMRCAAGTISQMKELVATLARVPVGHRAAEIDRCEGYALGFLWSNENVLHALRGHTMRDEL